jgi:hypothetical protein
MIQLTMNFVLRKTSRSSRVHNTPGQRHFLRGVLIRWRWTSVVLGTTLMACPSCSTTRSACASAGGTCILGSGGLDCAKQASTSAQDCNSNPPNPGGGICCLEFQEGGSVQNGGVGPMSDSGTMTADGSSDTGTEDSATDDALASVSDTAQIDVSALNGAVPSCPVGYAHANVCCQSGPRQATVCLESGTRPFQPCNQDSITFPDPANCCPLSGDGPCIRPAAASDASVIGACSFPCAPVGYSPAKLPSDSPLASSFSMGFCSTASAGEPCDYCCYGGLGTPCLSNQCNCPATGPCHCGPQCGTCPAGWQAPVPGQVDLCCHTDLDGATAQCFSQSERINSPDSNGCFSSPSGCECDRSGSDGHYYEAWCDSASTMCTCAIDGKTTKTTASAECSVLLASGCGFPADA